MILPSETIIFILSNIYANSFIFHPLYPDTIYTTFGAGSNSDGLYKSTNCGNTWSVVSYCDFASCVAVPSFPPGVLVLGSNKFGIQQSVNDGLTWNPMNNNLNNLNVLSLTNLMLAGGGPLFIAGTEGGIYRHYPNYWNNTSAAVNITVPGLSVYRENANLIWAALDGGSYSDGMYKSTDYGQTWTVSDWWLFITDILINPLDSQTVYASDSLDGVKITRNGGTSWQSFNTNLNDSTGFIVWG